MFQNLQEKLEEAFKKFKNKGKLTEKDVREGMRAVKLALLEADVNFKVVRSFINTVTERAVGAEVLESLVPAQQVIKIVNEELTALMGNTVSKIQIASKPPTIIMMVGLQGAGKTTHTAKLAAYFKKDGKKTMLAACDIYRPAAIKQLQVVGEAVGVPVFTEEGKNAVKIAEHALKECIHQGCDMLFIDTAGRLHIDEVLMEELRSMLGEQAGKAGLTLRMVIDEKIPRCLFGDKAKMQEILTNLINNAIKYTEEGSITVRVFQEERTEQHVMLCMEVEDTGIGIEEKNFDKVFGKFEQFDKKRNYQIEGSGLGLSIAKSLAELQGGSLTLDIDGDCFKAILNFKKA